MQAIETIYNNYRFRSRLEARWAVFFDALGIKWEYEKEGYTLTRGKYSALYYLPDFWLPEHRTWIEIKGEEPTPQERTKAFFLSLHSKHSCYIFAGNIGFPDETENNVYRYSFYNALLRHPAYEEIMEYQRGHLALFDGERHVELKKKYAGTQPTISITNEVNPDIIDLISGLELEGMSVRIAGKGELEFVEIAKHNWKPGQKEQFIDIVGNHIRHSEVELINLLKKHPGWCPLT